MKRALIALIALLCTVALQAQVYTNPKLVLNSSHDFSITSTAADKASTQTEVCIFCHTPHRANPKVPLWNHTGSAATYTPYSSSTLKATVAAPLATDSSKLCLGCHDGTVALGSTVNDGTITFANGITTLPSTARSNLGTNLADDHPNTFAPTVPTAPAYPQVVNPGASDAVKLDATGRVQCTSCHTPHEEKRDTTTARFLVKINSASAICLTCHKLQSTTGAPHTWSWGGAGQQSSHVSATNAFTTATNDGGVTWLGSHTGYTTTATNGCESCHRTHTAHDAARLLKGDTDQVCFQCHDGNTTTNILEPAPNNATVQNMATAFSSKTYKHPGTGTSQTGHDPNEAAVISTSRHGACDDCHNPHASAQDATAPTAPAISATMYGVSGVNAAGTQLNPRLGTGEAANQYEVCFKCHADSTNKPQLSTFTTFGPTAVRQATTTDQWNERKQFATTFTGHNVMQPLSGRSVPSLRANMLTLSGGAGRALTTAGSYLYCTDCHTNDAARSSGGTGPNGTHGSNWEHLLEREFVSEKSTGFRASTAATTNYALCNKCHDITNQIQKNTSFGRHSLHIGLTSCSTCHAPHGVDGGTATNNLRLVNFDKAIVTAIGANPMFTSTGTNHGRCYLTCHGENHNPYTY